MERTRMNESTKKRSPDGLLLPNQNTIINKIVTHFKRNKKSTMKFNEQKIK